ncbi:MAG TPA: questin oxidase family protein, partial [Nannocystaceae bacterium]|nr:questin oxidase family protein [Nannocystaceae bacterium]
MAWARRKFGLGIAAAPFACGRREEVEVTAPTSAPPSERTVLRDLLAENRTRDPEYGGGLSNHLSMALVALAQLGADDARLAAFARRYERRLDPMRALAEPIAWAKWRDAIGREAALTSLLAAFDLRLRERGRDEVLAEVLPMLVPALGAQLFHGLI